MPARRVVPDHAWTRDLLRDVLPVVVATRLFFVALTLAIPAWRAAMGTPPLVLHAGTAIHPSTGTVFDEWDRSDARWYEDVAHVGYNLRGPSNFKNVAFFPLYPLLTRTVHDAMAVVVRDVLALSPPGASYPPYLVPGMIVSNLCAVAALAFFYALVRLDYGRSAARRAATLLAVFPLSFFLFASYSEATFLLCAIACFYALRLERWWQAGLWGLLAAATRPPGALLLAPFLMAWAAGHPTVTASLVARARLAWRGALGRVRAHREAPRATRARPAAAVLLDLSAYPAGGRTPRRRAGDMGAMAVYRESRPRAWRWQPRHWPAEVRRAVRNGAPAIAIPLGLALFMAFLYRVFQDPLWFSKAQQAWWRTFAPPWVTLYDGVAWPLGDLLRGALTVTDAYGLEDMVYTVVGLALTVLAWRRLPRAQSVYMWLIWVVLLCSPAMLTERRTSEPHHDVLMSLPRMLLMMFPLFTYLGLSRRLFAPLIALFCAGLAVYTGMFLTGGWVS